ncbi:hypothetical protein B0H16DRAFT_1736551 [Mycena metata]|uniref:Uncharacterized protein n=1 Tax=Mycena metata TaxID=1033252 RepID=A0AAD7HPK7_9AGAR|nr:hypothetical protein B0H16DRAFT_1736551 [Mycena metata]
MHQEDTFRRRFGFPGQPKHLEDLSDAVHEIGVDFAKAVAQKDQEIDSELERANVAAASAQDEFKAVLDKLQLILVLSSLSPYRRSIQELISMGKDLLTKVSDISGKGTKNGKGAAALAAVKSLDAAKARLQSATEAKVKAEAANATRSAADTPGTCTAIQQTEDLLETVRKEEGKLAEAWNATAKELLDYLKDFTKNQKENTPATQRVLTAHVHKVTSSEAALRAFAASLEDAAHNS